MLGSVMPVPRHQFMDGNGRPLAHGWLHTYLAGTTTPARTYVDADQVAWHDNPLALDSAGRATVFLDDTLSYKFVLTTATGATVWSQDHVSAVSAAPATPTVEIAGIAGESMTLGSVVVLSEGALDAGGAATAGRWILASHYWPDRSNRAPVVGILEPPEPLAPGDPVQVRLKGIRPGLIGLTPGAVYYVGAGGDLTATRPLNRRVVGVGVTSTSLLIAPEPRDEDLDVYALPIEFGGHHAQWYYPTPPVFDGIIWPTGWPGLVPQSMVHVRTPSQFPAGTIRVEAMIQKLPEAQAPMALGLFDMESDMLVMELRPTNLEALTPSLVTGAFNLNRADTTPRTYGFKVSRDVSTPTQASGFAWNIRMVRDP